MKRIGELEVGGLDLGDEDPMPMPAHAPAPVTLAQIRRSLIEDLDIALDNEAEAVTFEPRRVSRAAERFTALGTYGHPGFQRHLYRFADAPAEPGDESLILYEDDRGRHAVAYRADRTPPTPVTSIDDLVDMGPPVALGDADELARQSLRREQQRSAELERSITEANQERWLAQLQRSFKRLVARAVRAGQSLGMRHDSEAPPAMDIWHELIGGQDHWRAGTRFAQYLVMPLDTLLPKGGPGADNRSDAELRAVRGTTAGELRKLIKEYARMRPPSG